MRALKLTPLSRNERLRKTGSLRWKFYGFCLALPAAIAWVFVQATFHPVSRLSNAAVSLFVALVAFLAVKRYEAVAPDPFASHYVLLEEGFLQIKGQHFEETLEARFDLNDLASIRLVRSTLQQTASLAQAMNDLELVIAETCGTIRVFHCVGWIYDPAQLHQMVAAIGREISQRRELAHL